MQVSEIMTENPAFCLRNTGLPEVARMMVDCDCGAIPVVESNGSMRPIGIITDRDIVTRTVAQNKNPLELQASDAMTSSTVTISYHDNVEDAANKMADNMIRRILVIDDDGRCVGVLSQADIALETDHAEELVDKVSRPTNKPSNVSDR